MFFLFFFFNDTATTEIYTLSLHDALPIWSDATVRELQAAFSIDSGVARRLLAEAPVVVKRCATPELADALDRKSTRLNSSHANISYAVFCLKKKKDKNNNSIHT